MFQPIRTATLVAASAVMLSVAACTAPEGSLRAPFSHATDATIGQHDNTYRAYVLDALNLIRDTPDWDEKWDPAAAVFTINGLRQIPPVCVRDACDIYMRNGGYGYFHSSHFAGRDQSFCFKIPVLLTLAFPHPTRDFKLLREALLLYGTLIDVEAVVKVCPTFPVLIREGLPFVLHYGWEGSGIVSYPFEYLETEFAKLKDHPSIEPGNNPIATLQAYFDSPDWAGLSRALGDYKARCTRASLQQQAMRCVKYVGPEVWNLLRQSEKDVYLSVAEEGWPSLMEFCAKADLMWDAKRQSFTRRPPPPAKDDLQD